MDDWKRGEGVRDLESFEAAADAFGGDLALWPAPSRAQAEAFLSGVGPDVAAEGRRILEQAAELDAALAVVAQRQPRVSSDLMARMLADAEREKPGFWRRFHTEAQRTIRLLAERVGQQISPDRGLTLSASDFGLGALGGLGATAAAAGLVFGLFGPADVSTDGTADWSGRGEIAVSESVFLEPFAGEDEFDLSGFSLDDGFGLGEESDG